ncbi:MAG: HYR domain-containing protein, partial [Cyclobacteriaceae bacterium]
DSYGNEAFCTFNVIVNDATPPVISNCPSDIIINASENCDAVVSWTAPTATDNCAMASFTNSHVSGSTFPIGETEVTYTASDASGNTAVCQFKVTITNQQLPVITNCPSDITADSDINEGTGKVTWNEPLASIACGNVSLISTHQSGSDFPIGTTRVEYTAKSEEGIITTCSFNVTINFIATAVKVGKVVTPDGDGFNDVWSIEGIEEFADNHVIVIDRWGSVIYEGSGYDNANVVWDGANQSGLIVPTGTYFYTLEIRAFGNTDKRKGFIELIR